MSRQQIAFLEECRKIKGCGSLREDFYTKFKSKKSGFGAVTWWKKGERKFRKYVLKILTVSA